MSVTLSLFAGAGAQFLDNNGNILSGGLIYTYSAGTTTPLATYTSNLGTTAQPNPIILDSAGRIPGGELWLTTGYGYKFVTKDANDVLIGTYDNVPSSAQPPITNDASSIAYEQGTNTSAGSFIVGVTYLISFIGTTNFQLIGATSNTVGLHFIATGAGSGTGTAQRSRTVQSKLQEQISVKDFGAVGDGITDDSAAFIAAMNAVVANGPLNVKALFVPSGEYLITQDNVLGQWNSINTSIYKGVLGFALIGEGARNTTITLKNTGATDLYLYNNYSGTPGVATNNSLQFPTFTGITFNSTSLSTGNCYAFRPYGTPNGYPSQGFQFFNCGFNYWKIVIWLDGNVNCSENTFFGCRVYGCGTFFHQDNPQAGNNNFFAVSCENYLDYAFKFNYGGQIAVIGGSYISESTNSRLLSITPAYGGTGAGYFFSNIRTEMHNNGSKLIELTGNDNDSQVTFDTCQFATRTGETGIVADSIKLQSNSLFNLIFKNCNFNNDGITWLAGSLNYYIANQPWANVLFDSCFYIDYTYVTWQSPAIGFTKFKNTGIDFEGGLLGLNQGNNNIRKNLAIKVCSAFSGFAFPNFNNTTPWVMTLPIGSVIKSIKVYFNAGGVGGAQPYQLQVQDGTGTPIVVNAWATGSNASAIGTSHAPLYIVCDNLMLPVIDATSATIQLTYTAGNAGDGTFWPYNVGSWFLVEYY